METPLVSICSITYNHAPFIRQCLDSFLMQQTNFPIEVIINDDCSTDGTTEILREYAAKYPDVIFPVYQQENQYSKGENCMFQRHVFPKARGKYIALCEGDDYWTDPLKLQKQVDFLESHPDYSMCFHKAKVIVQDGREYVDYFSKLEEREYKADEILTRWIVPTASILFRADVHVPEHKDFIAGDTVIHTSCAVNGRVYCMQQEMSVYRLHNAGWSANAGTFERQIIKSIPHRLALLELFPSSQMRGAKRMTACRCCDWLFNYKRYRGTISAKYVFKALHYCNYDLLYMVLKRFVYKFTRM